MAVKSMFTSALSGLSPVDPESVQFQMFTDEDVKKLSVIRITNHESFDILGNATSGGLYDLAMGPSREKFEKCGTCSNTLLNCPGHFGHIELPVVVVNPLFIPNIYTIFRISCLKCFKIQMNDRSRKILKLQMDLVDAGHVTSALDLENFTGELTVEGSEKPSKIIKKYQKLLKNRDGVTDMFKNKNTDVIKKRILNNYIKPMSLAKSCMYCQSKVVKITKSENRLMHNHVAKIGAKTVKILMPDEIQNYCRKIAQNDADLLGHCLPILKFSKSDPITNVFFMDVLPVPPPNIRPTNFLLGQLVEHSQTNVYRQILSLSFQMTAILAIMSATDHLDAIGALDEKPRAAYESAAGNSPAEKLHSSWQELQNSVNNVLSCDAKEKGQSLGVKQILERKTGIIRMHMMGKRVNFAARSVITPDPNVDIDEIGVPDAFAKILTYPVPVTEWNVEELRKMVINGPNKHPGAEKLEIENGRVILIPADSIQKRKSLAKRLLTPDEYKSSGLKIVHRHLLNGDMMILNRQPSLHKPSMMAHRARILKGEKTLRLHYANCKSYNADFDGDEMNAHFPQNEIARSEAYNIMSVQKQYLVPKDGTPLSGLIQDHVISGVKMSLRGSFFTKSDYQQLVFQALANHKGEIKLLPPAILKPRMLWSGKQVLSTIIINNTPKGKSCLSLTSKAKISASAWQKAPEKPWKAGGTPFTRDIDMSEAEVIIQNGELLCGVLDKTHYGATPYGLVHCMFELYGGSSSSALLSSFSKVFTYYLQWAGFTLGVKDILVVEEADKIREEFICLVRNSGRIAASKATELPLDIDEQNLKDAIGEMLIADPKFRTTLDRQYKSMLDEYTNKINTACLKKGLLEKFPYNNLQLMVQSGAKGSTVNTMQISCLLGQIELEGKRPPLMISGKSLPSFSPYDTSPRAGGFIDGRFMTGIQPQEFFFHCMAGREGLIDTAVKTSRSGYLQRCLIKHLEGLSVNYDYTVRDSDGSVIQFAYGEDGLDVLKCQFLKKDQFKFLDDNSKAVIAESVIERLKEEADSKAIAKAQRSIKKWKKKNGNPTQKIRLNPFTDFCRLNKSEIDLENPKVGQTRDPYYKELARRWRALDDEDRQQYGKQVCPDPVQSKASPEFKIGVINERLNDLIQNYLKNRHETPYTEYTEKENFVEVINAKYLASMADPGEPVGLLAAQSIGEPSTQMTLNTFHFAGRGDMNVTLGIPRLREILMTASANLKTPNMEIPFHDIPDVSKKSQKLRIKLNRVTVADVLEKIDVECEIVTYPARQMKTKIRFHFLPHKQYKARYCVKPAAVLHHMQKKFFGLMFATVRRHAKSVTGVVWTSEKKGPGRRKAAADDDDDDDDELEQVAKNAMDLGDMSSDEEDTNDDDDNTDARLRKKRAEGQEYDDSDSEIENKDDEEQDDEGIQEEDKTNKENTIDEDILEVNAEDISEKDSKIINEVVTSHQDASNYIFDTKKHIWCEITVMFPISFLKVDLTQALREAATKSVIHEVKNIKRAIVNADKGKVTLTTEGINILQMFKYNHILDINRIYSNDVHAIANTYGIEAGNKVIIKEIQNVFNVYGITVDPRHLSLIADYMTFNGKFEPMSRKGMEASSSPLQQMSFESSMVFLKEAVVNAKFDHLRSSSSCLMLGQPCKIGTGSFSLQHFSKNMV